MADPFQDKDWTDWLEPGEHLVWQGSPKPYDGNWRPIFHTFIGIMPVVVLIPVIAAWWTHLAPGPIGRAIAAGLPLLMAGGFALAMSFVIWRDALYGHVRRRYLLTNRRALVVTSKGKLWGRAHPISPKTILWIQDGDSLAFSLPDDPEDLQQVVFRHIKDVLAVQDLAKEVMPKRT